MVVSDGVEDYRAEPGSEGNAYGQMNIFPVDGDRGWTRDVFMLKIASRWQFVNQWKSTMATSSEDSGSTEQIASSWDEHC